MRFSRIVFYFYLKSKLPTKKDKKNISNGIHWYVHLPLPIGIGTEGCTTRLILVTSESAWDLEGTDEVGLYWKNSRANKYINSGIKILI